MSSVQCPISNVLCPISIIQCPMSLIQRIISISILISQFLLLSCSKEKGIAEVVYNPPYKDSIKFAYRLNTLYYFDENSKETSFDFTLDSGLYYAWKSVSIFYEEDSTLKQYSPIYTNGNITSWIDNSFSPQHIDLAFKSIPPSNIKLISTIKYYRNTNPFALVFLYDSVNLSRVELRNLDRENGEIGGLLEFADFCSTTDLGSCSKSISGAEYFYGNFFNSLYHSNELVAFMFILNKPNQSNLIDILPYLPLYFSRHYPDGITKPILGSYEVGLNAKKEPTYLYYHPLPENLVLGFNFSMR